MYTGKHFRLKQDILGIENANYERVAVTILAGQMLRVLSGPRPDDRRMVDVLWGDRTLVVSRRVWNGGVRRFDPAARRNGKSTS